MRLINGHYRNPPRMQNTERRNNLWIIITEWVDEKCRDRKNDVSKFLNKNPHILEKL